MKDQIRIAQIKIVPVKGDLQANHEQLMAVLDQVAQEPVDVVVTPECFLDGYVSTEEEVTRENMHRYAVDPQTSPLIAKVAEWARRQQAWVILGCTRLAPGGGYNTALVFDRQGTLKGMYDKIHCHSTHDSKYLPGQQLRVFDSDFGLFGVMICADRRWPETVRSLALQGARVIFNPTYGMYGERNLWLMRTRSYESEIFIAFTHPLEALLTTPAGDIVVDELSDQVSFCAHQIDLSEVDRIRGEGSHLRNRVPEIYKL